MSRIRSIHPGIWTDVEFVSLSAFARMLFIGIWNECDDKGIFPWSPLQLKMRLLPADNIDASALMDEIEAVGSIRRFDVAGKAYGAVKNFAKFQRPKKPNDIHPSTPEILTYAGHVSETDVDKTSEVRKEFPTNGEKSPQMEEGGGRRIEEPKGSRPSDDEPTFLEDDQESDKLKPEDVIEAWNVTADKIGLARVVKLTDPRRKRLKTMIAQHTPDDFAKALDALEASPFCRGEKTDWRADFDFFLQSKSFTKLLEGSYV